MNGVPRLWFALWLTNSGKLFPRCCLCNANTATACGKCIDAMRYTCCTGCQCVACLLRSHYGRPYLILSTLAKVGF
jgi:hypothetical protein